MCGVPAALQHRLAAPLCTAAGCCTPCKVCITPAPPHLAQQARRNLPGHNLLILPGQHRSQQAIQLHQAA